MRSSSFEPVVQEILTANETDFRRAAAAFGNHHARRGGLLEHTAQMLRCAVALAPLYPNVHASLLYAGVILHDIGKIRETNYPAQGFVAEHTIPGELLGHIADGVAQVVAAWSKVWGDSGIVMRDHLLHLVLSHHGQNEWGSPVTPKTPEAILLHQIDMIDSRMEMYRQAFDTTPESSDLAETRRGHLVRSFSER
jgi:3'-5' exoribonuclease